jgi:hypothetical protein
MFSQDQVDQTFLDKVAQLHAQSGVVDDLAKAKAKFPKLYQETLTAVQNAAQNPADTSWQEFARTQYGWVLDLYNAVPELQSIIDAAVASKWTAARFTNAVESTNWWKTTEAKQRNYVNLQNTDPSTLAHNISQMKDQVAKVIGATGYTLDDATIQALADKAYKFGWTSTELDKYVGSEVIKHRAGASSGQDITEGADAANVRQLAMDYGLSLTPDAIDSYTKALVSKQFTTEQIKQHMQMDAENLYPALKGQLQMGRTVGQITSPYKQLAATVLNIDPNAVDFTDAEKWGRLLSYQDPKSNETRMMNVSEWQRYLQTLPEWQQTDDAKNIYRSLASTITRDFGKVK